jgi:hypothetical protein
MINLAVRREVLLQVSEPVEEEVLEPVVPSPKLLQVPLQAGFDCPPGEVHDSLNDIAGLLLTGGLEWTDQYAGLFWVEDDGRALD